jgi:PmbA protein
MDHNNDSNMTKRLTALLSLAGIEDYLIRECRESRVEYYYIKKALDTKRSADTQEVTVRVYRSFTEGGVEYRGSSTLLIFPSMTDEEIEKKLREGYAACLYIKDETYPPAPPVREDAKGEEHDLGAVAAAYADALFSADRVEGAFVNSAEIFTVEKRVRIVTSHGTDVSYASFETAGEMVVGSKEKEDVELYDAFRYDGECYGALADRVRARLCEARDRSHARRLCESGEYSVILEGGCVREMLGYALWKASARNIHTGYSQASVGAPVGGALPDITAIATEPYSAEGIKMRDLAIVRDGRLCAVVGGMRFCSYLGCEGTGEYERISAESGGAFSGSLFSGKCLHVVSFSDFQFDPLDGYFGGEVRLGYLIDGDEKTPVTGFSISGNYRELGDSFVFSEERTVDYSYDGPRYMKIAGVVAG